MTGFEGVVPALSQALTKREYSVLTPVQTAVLAPELKDADLLVSAQTGSGKTVAFGLAIAPTLLGDGERFEKARSPLALAVAPTRELALQVKRELEWLFAETGASIASCVGGMDMRTERSALNRGAHIVVGTPGRLRDHIERGSLDLKSLKAVVLDEADEMLDLGFRDDLEYMLGASPNSRRTLMFSATVPRSIGALAKRYQRDAVRVSTQSDEKQHLDIDYRAMTVAPNDRENAIVNVLRFFEAKNALVFCSTRANVNHMTSRLNNRGFSVVALSGELSQNERTHALQAMRDGRARVCVATDVAARGIDLPNLELVVHADIPKTPETLLHRSGRTGRAGRKGVCTLIVPHNWRGRTERLLRNANIEANWERPPSVEQVMVRDRERILDDPAFSEPLSEFEDAFAKELLERHGPDKIAGALVRQHLSKQTAPEELLDTGPAEAPKKRREDFKNGVWISLSVGRDHNAEPRWLLPLLCRTGNMTKNEIGAIRIHPTETHVEIAPEFIEQFLAAVGPSGKMEKTISVTRLKGAPEAPRGSHGPRGSEGPRGHRGKRDSEERPYEKKRPFKKKPFDKKPYDKNAPPAKRKHASRAEPHGSAESKPYARADAKPYARENAERLPATPRTVSPGRFSNGDAEAPRGETPRSDAANPGKKPKKNKDKKNKGKKSFKPKHIKASDKPAGRINKRGSAPLTAGAAPLKRKKLQIKTD